MYNYDFFNKFGKLDFKKCKEDTQVVVRRMREIEDEILSARVGTYIDRIDHCGDGMKYYVGETKASYHTHLCNNPFCYTCVQIKQQKEYTYILRVMDDYIFNNPANYNIQFGTVSFKNVKVEELAKTLSDMKKVMMNFMNYYRIYRKDHIANSEKNPFIIELAKKMIGFYYKIEYTYNNMKKDFHPHIHFIAVLEEGQSITQESWSEGMKIAFKLDYLPQTYIEPVKANDEEDVVVNVAKIVRYMGKGLSVDWKKLPKEIAHELLRQIIIKLGRKSIMRGSGGFFNQYKRVEVLNSKKEEILDKIGEREEGLTDKEIDEVAVVNPTTKKEYSHQEKKNQQMSLWNMSNQQLGLMLNDENNLKAMLAKKILAVKQECDKFRLKKEDEFKRITDTSLEEILKRQRKQRKERLENKNFNPKCVYNIFYNRSLCCFMVSSCKYLDSLGNTVTTEHFNTFCRYQDFQFKLDSGEIIHMGRGVYCQLNGKG